MKTLFLLAVLGVAAWYVYHHTQQIHQVQQAAVNYAQGLKNDAQDAKNAEQQVKQQTQALQKSLQDAKSAQ